MKDNGSKALLKGKAYSIIRMAILMMVNGNLINAMVSEFTITKLRMPLMKVSGKTIFNLVEEPRHGKTDQNILVPTKRVRSRAMVHILGLMALCIKETGSITK